MTDSMLPNETLQSQLSAFVDEELPKAESDLFVRRLVKDGELKQAMGRYQLIGEALRAPVATTHLSRDFSARIAAALEQQETPAAEVVPATAASKNGGLRWLKPAAGMALAASVALVAVMAVRNQPTDLATAAMSAEALEPVVPVSQRVAANGANSYVVPTGANAPTAPIPTARLTNYVVAHSEFSSPLGRRNMMTGLLAGDQGATAEVAEETQASDPTAGR